MRGPECVRSICTASRAISRSHDFRPADTRSTWFGRFASASPLLRVFARYRVDLAHGTGVYVLQVARMGVRDYLLKSCLSTNRLLERVRCLLDQASSGEMPAAARPQLSPAPTLTAAVGNPSTVAVAEPRATALLKCPKPSISQPPPNPSPGGPELLTRDQTLERLDQIADGKTIAGVVAQKSSPSPVHRGPIWPIWCGSSRRRPRSRHPNSATRQLGGLHGYARPRQFRRGCRPQHRRSRDSEHGHLHRHLWRLSTR